MGKAQHFVPRFYLGNFSEEPRRRRISVYHIPTQRYFSAASTKGQACRSWFYGHDNSVENSLADLESCVACVISKLIRQRRLPDRDSLGFHRLLAFVVLQEFRTAFASDGLLETVNRMAQVVYGGDPRFEGIGTSLRIKHPYPVLVVLNNVLWAWPLLLDLGAKLICSDGNVPFVTSDNPVIAYNQFLEEMRPYQTNTGLLTKGLQILLPVSPDLALFLYDRHVYRVGRRRVAEPVPADGDDMESVNRLQVLSATSTIYAPQSLDETYLKRLVRSCRRSRIMPGADVREYQSADDPDRRIVGIHGPEIRCGLKLSFARTHRRLRHFKDDDKLAIFRDPDVFDLAEEFRKGVRDGHYGVDEFYSFLVRAGKARPLTS